MESSKVLLVKGKAGLGNRILSVLGSIVYADLTSRELIVDWSDRAYSDDRTNVFNRFYASPVTRNDTDLNGAPSVWPEPWVGHLTKSVDEVFTIFEKDPDADRKRRLAKRYTADFGKLQYPADVLVRWSYFDEMDLLRLHLRRKGGTEKVPSADALLTRILKDRLVLHPSIAASVDSFAEAHLKPLAIGLHVRYTDHKLSYAGYPRIIDGIRERHPEAVIFLATDNVAVEKWFKERYKRVVTTAKWYAEAGTPLHRTRECPAKFTIGCEALTEMYLLARCQYLVFNRRSSFGQVARYLSSAPSENIFDMAGINLRTPLKHAYRWLTNNLATWRGSKAAVAYQPSSQR